jgi:hypothetical protein
MRNAATMPISRIFSKLNPNIGSDYPRGSEMGQ